MSRIIPEIVRATIFILLLFSIAYPAGADVPDENVSDAPLFPEISGLFSAISDLIFNTSSDGETGNGGSGDNDILETIESINLVKYEDRGLDGDIGEYIKENINSSISQEIFEGKSDLQRDLYILLSESRSYPDGFSTDGFEIFIYPLVTDDDLSSPSSLSRPNGLKITLYVYSISEPDGKTIQVYEKYSTDIIREIYEAGYGDEFGTIYLKFIDMDSGDEILHLALDASDSEENRKYWTSPSSYIGVDGWSKVKLNNEYGIAYYEDNTNRIWMDPEDYLIPDDYQDEDPDSSGENVISYDPLLTNSISASYDKIVSMVDEIGEHCNNGERDQVISTANDLGDYLYKLKKNINEIPVSSNFYGMKSQYLNALELISDASSEYWHFSIYHDSDSLSGASEDSVAGLSILNSLLDETGGAPVDIDALDRPSEKNTLINTYSMFDTFHYRDSSGSNDISFQVDNWNLRNSLLTKNVLTGEQETISSEYNTIFLVVTVDFTHLGYRGGGPEQIVTPPGSSFKLQYGGTDYAPLDISDYLENSGEPYQSKKVERREIYKSVLVFEIENNPGQTFDDEDTYLSVDLGDYGVQTWSLEKPE
ncbi:hypothetical protein Mpet_1228 [Methanolacinia petrolearia DSM 11571]|uniref:Uncharacterized protein n=1 Tax=Methanolacinia petrolearia (strain DSM 11571 / OCM 486 / SEBR 4847) TaxID=679926 RepID=E1RDN6_METP4|nr:hypothetical protein [Methanolacinia petrolearia]ADN35989.1 hypothetical protein Mpet_1228 [Methanolacinia petrolearia DSM 11571]